MRQHTSNGPLEINVGAHPARAGWEVAKITYNADNALHLRQVDAAIAAMLAAREQRGGQDAGANGGAAQ